MNKQQRNQKRLTQWNSGSSRQIAEMFGVTFEYMIFKQRVSGIVQEVWFKEVGEPHSFTRVDYSPINPGWRTHKLHHMFGVKSEKVFKNIVMGQVANCLGQKFN